MVLKTKYDLGQEVYYGEPGFRKKGEIVAILFNGSFNNMPIYEIEYNGNIWCEDEVSDKE